MAKMIPARFPEARSADPKFNAEALVYRTLQERLPVPWVVIYAFEWTGHHDVHSPPVNGEADFVAIHPDRGFVVIEVKGGRIEVDDEHKWVTIDREGRKHTIDPFSQARRSLYAIREKLRKLAGWQTCPIHAIQVVVLTDRWYERPPVAAAYSDETVILRDQLERIDQFLDRLLPRAGVTYPEDLALAFQRLLHPIAWSSRTLANQIGQDSEHFAMLASDQLDVFHSISLNERVLVSGVAGSGKTILALQTAQRLASQGKRTLLTCYNKKLAQALRAQAGERPNLTIRHFHDLCWVFAEQAGIGLAPKDGVFTDELFDNAFPEALDNAARLRPELRFDAVVVDEGQDFLVTWWLALETATVAGVRTPLYVFYDPLQSIFGTQADLPPAQAKFALQSNRRNTRSIARFVDRLLGTKSEARGLDGRPIEFIRANDSTDAKIALGECLIRLVKKEQVAPEQIAVLSPRFQKSVFYQARCGGFLICEAPQNQKEIYFSSISGFKGLERQVVVLVELDHARYYQDTEGRRLVAVGASRAQSHLIIIAPDDVVRELKPLSIAT